MCTTSSETGPKYSVRLRGPKNAVVTLYAVSIEIRTTSSGLNTIRSSLYAVARGAW